jgi:hypothetical protein
MLRSRFCYCVLCPILGLALALLYHLLLATPAAVAQAPATGKELSFIKDVAPILKKNCFGCHDAGRKKGKLDMTTYETFRKGGRHNDVLVPGDTKKSYILEVLTASDASRMPPKDSGKPLPKADIDVIAAWIQQGAKLDNGITAKDDLRRVLRLRWQPPTLLTAYTSPALITSLAITPDGQKVVASGYHELSVWDVQSGKLEKRLHTRSERAHEMRFLKDGKLAVAGGRPGQEGDVRVYDLGGKSTQVNGVAVLDGVNDPSVLVAELVQTEDEILCLGLSDDGNKLASGGCDRLVRVWDISAGVKAAKLEQTIENHADWVLSVNFSANGQYLITGGRDKSAKVWDLNAKESLVTFPGHQEIVFGAVLSADGKFGISAGVDKQVRWWDAQDKSKNLGKQTRAQGGHAKEIFKLIQFKQGPKQVLATTSADGTVRLWDATSGANLKTLTGLKDWVYAVAASSDGKLVAAGGQDSEVHVWDTTTGKEVKVLNVTPGYTAAKVQASSK